MKTKINGVLMGYTVAMVRFWVMKVIITCLSMTGNFFDAIVIASTEKRSSIDSSTEKCSKNADKHC